MHQNKVVALKKLITHTMLTGALAPHSKMFDLHYSSWYNMPGRSTFAKRSVFVVPGEENVMLEFSKNQKLAIYAIAGIIALGVSVKVARSVGSQTQGEVVLTEPARAQASDKVIFQVAGSIKQPGVYTLPHGSRVIDAIESAGGAKPGANLDSMNLAAPIEDGTRIYVPLIDEQPEAGAMPAIAAGTSSGPKAASPSNKLHAPSEGKVNINTADATELQRLPGVGPSTAEAILEYRSQIRRFNSVDQLDDVKGIGPKKLEKMRPFVAL